MTIKATDEWTRVEKDAARALLLGPSPYEADGGELIGRDPRQIPVSDYDAAGLSGSPILKVIRAKCMDCCVGQEAEVRKCVAVACPNWPYRMGTNPFRAAGMTDEERAKRVEQGRALAAGRAARMPLAAVLPSKLPSENSADGVDGSG